MYKSLCCFATYSLYLLSVKYCLYYYSIYYLLAIFSFLKKYFLNLFGCL